jgi:acyl-CoA reductase-like NAD-dependent aldehyde dehydrogenase
MAATMNCERDALLIGGQWEAAGHDWTEVINPATEEVIGRVRTATTEDVDRSVSVARNAFDHGPWPRLRWAERSGIIVAALGKLRTQCEEIGRLVTSEMGAPLHDSVRSNIPGAIAMGKAMIRHAGAIEQRTVRDGRISWALIDREPVGVVASIAPWNGPFYFAILKSIPALLAGCTVVLKPAPETPLDAFYLGEALYDAGLPPGVFSVVPGDGWIGDHLVRHLGVDKVSFTGSTAVGRRVGAICGEQLKRCSLELGGKSAAIVLEDADAETTVESLKAGGFFNAGQVCAALTRVLVPDSRRDELVARLAGVATALRVGDPLDDATELGPLVSARQRDRVESYIAGALEEGATLEAGGNRPRDLDRGWFIEPTVFSGVTNDMTIAREEVFGPVISVLAYETVDEGIAIANDSQYGLHGAVFSADSARAIEIAERLVTGTVSVNTFALNSDAPFGGRKASGIGREFGPEGIASFLEYKTINVSEEVGRAQLH